MTERKVSGDAPVKPEHDNNKKKPWHDSSKKDTFLSVIYCLTRRVQLDRGSFNPDYPIKSGNDSKESKSGNDCKWKPPLQKAERQNKTLSPAGRTPASYA